MVEVGMYEAGGEEAVCFFRVVADELRVKYKGIDEVVIAKCG